MLPKVSRNHLSEIPALSVVCTAQNCLSKHPAVERIAALERSRTVALLNKAARSIGKAM